MGQHAVRLVTPYLGSLTHFLPRFQSFHWDTAAAILPGQQRRPIHHPQGGARHCLYPDAPDKQAVPKDDDQLEREENEILPTDNMLVTAIVEQNVPQLHFFVYDEPTEYLGPHHDLLLSSMPLCLEWLDYPAASIKAESMDTEDDNAASRFGNYVAIGTLDPDIEIYSIDHLEAVYPDVVLGNPKETAAHVPEPAGTGKKKRKKAKHRASSEAYHVDAVLSLSWNRTARQMLASGSADRTVKLWDLSRDPKEGALRSFGKLHRDKVQSVQWNPTEPTVLLSGSYDRTVRVFDSRAPDASVGAVVGADVEAIRWDPWDNHGFYVRGPFSIACDVYLRYCYRFRWRTGWWSISTRGHCHRISTNPHPPVSRSRRMMAQRVRWT